jgi:ribosome biogenesis protein MAK21
MASRGASGSAWHEELEELEQSLLSANRVPTASPEELAPARRAAERTLDRIASSSKTSPMSTAASRKDREAAAALAASARPIAALPELESLVSTTENAFSPGNKASADRALNSLSEIFASNAVLPPSRKLRRFAALPQPIASGASSNQSTASTAAAYRLFEDRLKRLYARFVSSLSVMSTSSLNFLKERSVRHASNLLINKPECEIELLRIVVNKLGEPQKKAASKASFFLRSILSHHPSMKSAVAREVMAMCSRPNVQMRAKYYAVVFLHQLPLSHKGSDPTLAKELVHWYISLFTTLMDGVSQHPQRERHPSQQQEQQQQKQSKHKRKVKNQKQSRSSTNSPDSATKKPQNITGIDSRIQRTILTGVNRAFPYVEPDAADAAAEQLEPRLYVVAHSRSIKASLQALSLLKQLQTSRGASSDRFHRSLYDVMLHEGLPMSSQASAFLSLAFKVMKEDTSMERQHAFVKRLLQVSLSAAPQFACGVLLLLSELLKERPHLQSAIMQPEEQTSPTEAEQAEPLNDAGAEPLSAGSRTQYDPRKREPKFTNAGDSCWWELELLRRHGHPSVQAMAGSLLRGGEIVYGGDPLADLSTMAFVDKFLNKSRPQRKLVNKPLVHRANLGEEAEQRLAGRADAADPKHQEEVYFHRFYKTKRERKGESSVKKSAEATEAEGYGALDAEDEENEEAAADRAIEGDEEGARQGEVDYSQLQMPSDEEGDLAAQPEGEEDLLDESEAEVPDTDGAAEDVNYEDDADATEDLSLSVETGKRTSGPFALAEDYGVGVDNEAAIREEGAGGIETTIDDLICSAPEEKKRKRKRKRSGSEAWALSETATASPPLEKRASKRAKRKQ